PDRSIASPRNSYTGELMLTHQMNSVRVFFFALAGVVGTALFATGIACAQEEGEGERAGSDAVLDQVVVTAQRRSQSLQDVPVSIETFSGDAMMREGLRTMTDLSTVAPGLVVRNQ